MRPPRPANRTLRGLRCPAIVLLLSLMVTPTARFGLVKSSGGKLRVISDPPGTFDGTGPRGLY